MIKENLANVRTRIRAACERSRRDLESVRLVAVTKEAGVDQIREAMEAGVTDIGENRVKDALSKKELLGPNVLKWHMVGHLQSNKAREAVKIFSLIHSVDSFKLAYILNKEAAKSGKVQDVLAEVNVSGEKSKYGLKPDEIGEFLKATGPLKNIKVLGLMTVAPVSEEPEATRPYFRELKELAASYGLNELSMGMTQDFEVAIEEGATMVRVGSAIFRSRK